MPALTAFHLLGWEIRPEILLLGVIIGAGYGLLAAGLVLVYRSSRLVNFAHGEVGVFAATIVYLGVNRWHLPYYVALLGALALAAAIGAAVESLVVARLSKAPKMMSLVATLGVAQLLVTLAAAISLGGGGAFAFPSPPGLPQFDVGILRVTPAYTATIVIAPILVVGLAVLLRATRLGLRIRASASNPEAARLAGINTMLSSRVTWALAGVLSAMTAILTAPSKGPGFAVALGPSLLLRGLAPALVARMKNLPVALIAGIGLGVIEQIVFWNQRSSANIDVIVFGIVLVATMFLPRERRRRTGGEGWGELEPWRPVREAARARFAVRHLGAFTGVTLVVVAAVLPLVLSLDRVVTLSSMVAYVVIGVGLAIVAGLGGQLSLGHFAIAGISATCSLLTIDHSGNFLFGLVVAMVVGAAVSLVVGLPALRLSGPFLAVTTLAAALAVPWLLGKSWLLGEGRRPQRPIIGDHAFTSGRSYYWFALAVAVVVVLVVARVRMGGMRRQLLSVRDGEDVARSFGVRVGRRKLQSFMVSGAIAGIGGALYAHGLAVLTPDSFPASMSLDLAVMVVIGGVSLLSGPMIGVLFVIGIPAFLPLDNAGLATTKLGLLLLVLYVPSGLAQLLLPLRDRLVRLLTRGMPTASGSTPPGSVGAVEHHDALAGVEAAPPGRREIGEVVLEAHSLTKHFGGIAAVSDMSIEVHRGEIVGLIGPNGAGKTTLFEMLAGFTRTEGGAVRLHGHDITSLPPAARARLGLVRSFQSSPLFPTLTVVETVATAFETSHPTRFSLAIVTGRAERFRLDEARALVERFGLGRYADRPVSELSTGTRRICELACMTALRPKVLLLDEPAAGLAQREVEALVPVLHRLQAELGCAMIVIEHDLPMIMSLSDRVVAMAAGRVIADGDPTTVKNDAKVVAAYLGRNVVTIERSGSERRKSEGSGGNGDG